MAGAEARRPASDFTLDDFKKLLGQSQKLGPIRKLMAFIPGMSGFASTLDSLSAERDMHRLTGMIDAMTVKERRQPEKVLDDDHARRVARGAGVGQKDVVELVTQFRTLADMMRQVSVMSLFERRRLGQ